jgi:hypothetical protein
MFPKDNIPASQKNKDWHLQWGRALAAWHNQNMNAENFPYTKLMELMMYLPGRQEVRRHKPNSNFLRNNNLFNDLGANHRNLKIAFSILNAVHGKLGKVQVAPSIKQIDSIASDTRADFENKVRRIIELNQANIKTDEVLAQMKINKNDFPLDDEEANIFLMNKPVIIAEAEMEAGIGGVFEEQKINTVRNMMRWDLLSLGVSGARTQTINNNQYIRPVDPLNCGTNICKYSDFRDIRFAYEIIPVAPETIRAQCGDYFTKGEYEKIESSAGYVNTNTYYRLTNYQQNALLTGDKYNFVIDFEVISTNNIDVEIKPNLSGLVKTNVFVDGRNPTSDRPDRAMLKMQPQVVYKGKFILGTDLIYDWGPKEKVARPPMPENPDDAVLSNPASAQLGFHFFQPSLSHGMFVSLLEVMLPFIDTAQKTWDKLTDVIYKIVPQGISIDIDAIIDISLGKGSKLEPLDIVDLFIQHGFDIYSSSTYKGMPNSSANRGVQFKDNPATQNMERLLNSFVSQINLLENIVGINSIVKGGQQSAEIGKAVSELQIQGTDNVLEGVLNAEVEIITSVAKHLMWTSQRYGLRVAHQGKIVNIDPLKHKLNIYNCKMDILPSPGEWQSLYADAKAFAAAGQIDYEDLIAIRKINSYTDAQLYLAYKRKRKERIVQEQTVANQERTFKGQQESAMVTAQAEAQVNKAKSDSKLLEIRTTAEEQRKTLIVQKALEMGKMTKQIEEILKQELSFVEQENILALQSELQEIYDREQQPAGGGDTGGEPIAEPAAESAGF